MDGVIPSPALAGASTGREAWRRRVELSADEPFLYSDGRTWTYGQVHETAARYAGALSALGVAQGTRIMVGLSNRPETVFLLVATLQLGAVAVPLQGGLTFDELAYQIGHCESEFLIADDPVARTVLPHLAELPNVRCLVADDTPRAALPLAGLAEGAPLPWTPLREHDHRSPALILYTSGSTGRPKGVVLPAGAFPSAGAAFDERFGFGPQDNYFLPLTMSHALGVVAAPAMAVMAGGALTVVDRFSPSHFWDQVARTGATASILFPTHLNLLLETAEAGGPAAGASSLRLVITHAWNERFRTRFGAELALVWGMTETGAMCTGGAPGERGDRDGFVGAPMVGVRVEVRDEDGRPVPPGNSGEICLHHPDAMIEYLKDSEATSRTLVDGWVRSGDLGTLDERGVLYFQGRIKNMIKRSGENISAEEVENAFTDLPPVSECVAFGVADPIRHEEVAVVVALREPAEAADLLAQAGQSLARWKLPRYVTTLDQPLPRLGNGKLDRRAIQQGFDRSLAHDREATATARRPTS